MAALESENKMQLQSGKDSKGAMDILSDVVDTIITLITITWYIIEGIIKLFIPTALKSVKGEIVLITGAGHGIGKELALAYSSQGATVVCWDINKNTNENTVKEIEKLGYPKAHAYICDVTNRNEVQEVAKKVLKEVGDVSVLINNAGIMPCHPFLEHTTEEIESIMNINVMAHYWILQAFLPTMIKNNYGHIVALSSVAGLTGTVNLVPYCTSKFAVRGMMAALEEELRVTNPKNQIKFTTVYPFMVDTGLCKRPVIRFKNLMPIEDPKHVAGRIMNAQRRNYVEVSIPRHLLSYCYYTKIHPNKVERALQEFLVVRVDSDK